MKLSPIWVTLLALIWLSLPGCNTHKEALHKVGVTSPQSKAVTLIQQYVCQIRSQHHINVRALETGQLATIAVKEGQHVKKGDLLFKIGPTLPRSKPEIKLPETKVDEEARLARAELDFAVIRAPFDGVVGKLQQPQESSVQAGETLTTLSENSVMWVYFNVPEARYLEYMADDLPAHKDELQIELLLANGKKFSQTGKLAAIGANFNHETGNVAFRADFPNPDGLLLHGQTGLVLIHLAVKDALVIPQLAGFQLLDKWYVFVVDKQNVLHQREVVIQKEEDDLLVIKSGISLDDKIVLQGIRHVRDGEKVECEVR